MNAETFVQVLPVLLVGVTAYVLPTLTRPTVQFGVQVPAERAAAPVILDARRAYRRRTLVLAVVAVLAALLGAGTTWVPLAVLAAELAVVLACYWLARRDVATVKAAEGWFEGLTQRVATDTSWRSEPERFPLGWALAPVAVLVATVATGIVRYPNLPSRLAVHFTLSGTPDRWADTSVRTAFSPVLSQVLVTVLVVGLLLLTYRSRPDLDSADPARSLRRYRVFLTRTARVLLLLAALVNLGVLLTCLQLWQVWEQGSAATALQLGPTLVGVVAVLVVLFRTGQAGSRLPDPAPAAPAPAAARDGVVTRDDDRYWKAGILYVNRDDPALLVGKRFGVGWTLNFGNPRALLLAAGFVLVMVAFTVAAALTS